MGIFDELTEFHVHRPQCVVVAAVLAFPPSSKTIYVQKTIAFYGLSAHAPKLIYRMLTKHDLFAYRMLCVRACVRCVRCVRVRAVCAVCACVCVRVCVRACLRGCMSAVHGEDILGMAPGL